MKPFCFIMSKINITFLIKLNKYLDKYYVPTPNHEFVKIIQVVIFEYAIEQRSCNEYVPRYVP